MQRRPPHATFSQRGGPRTPTLLLLVSFAMGSWATLGCAAAQTGNTGSQEESVETVRENPGLPSTDHASAAPDEARVGNGPAHERAITNFSGTWLEVAPPDARLVYDVTFFDERWYMLHGAIENSEKVILSESNWLSWSSDGMEWETALLTDVPFTSFTRLAASGSVLLLGSNKQIARWLDGKLQPLDLPDTQSYRPVLVPGPSGIAIGRFDDGYFYAGDRAELAYQHELAQFKSGVFADGRFLLFGAFASVRSEDGLSWNETQAPCGSGCILWDLAHDGSRYLATDMGGLWLSDGGADWRSIAYPEDTQVTRVSFTGGTFFVQAGDKPVIRVSADRESWSPPIELSSPEPRACDGRCVNALGRLLLPPPDGQE